MPAVRKCLQIEAGQTSDCPADGLTVSRGGSIDAAAARRARRKLCVEKLLFWGFLVSRGKKSTSFSKATWRLGAGGSCRVPELRKNLPTQDAAVIGFAGAVPGRFAYFVSGDFAHVGR